MVMVDKILSNDETRTVTSFRILGDNVFIEDGKLSEPGLMENMAQTAAAGTGARGEAADKPAQTGFIGGIKDLKINRLPAVGETITTSVRIEHAVLNATVIRAEVSLGGEVVAGCEMKIFLI